MRRSRRTRWGLGKNVRILSTSYVKTTHVFPPDGVSFEKRFEAPERFSVKSLSRRYVVYFIDCGRFCRIRVRTIGTGIWAT